MFIFVKEGVRKLSDLNTIRGNNALFILLGGTRWQGLAQLEEGLEPQKDRKV